MLRKKSLSLSLYNLANFIIDWDEKLRCTGSAFNDGQTSSDRAETIKFILACWKNVHHTQNIIPKLQNIWIF